MSVNVTSTSLVRLLGQFMPARENFARNINVSNIVFDDWSRFPGIPFAFNFERNLVDVSYVEWMHTNWSLCFYISLIYLVVIFSGRKLMSYRPAFTLRLPLLIWNLALSLFSLGCFIRTGPEFVHILLNEGLERSFCSNSYYLDARLMFWYIIFAWSKVIELGDTVFIVLRKQKLLFLHWLHHVLTLCYTFLALGDAPGTARWMVAMNSGIHAVMYGYYALRVLKVHVPRAIAMLITVAQIVQMIFGLYINYQAYVVRVNNIHACDTSEAASFYGLVIYGIFFMLFIKFFVNSYLSCTKRTQVYKEKKLN